MINRPGLVLAAVCASIASAPASAETLFGSNVSAAIYCCMAPTEAYRISDFATAVVSNATEFPASTFVFTVDGSRWDSGIVDIGESWIRITSLIAEVTNPGTFNGMIFAFTGSPTIIAATLNPASTMVPTSVVVAGNAVVLNAPSMTVGAGSYMLIDVTLAPVPEPAPLALLIAGGVTLTFWLRRRRRSDA